MPTYEYRCGACGKEFEIVHGMSEPARTTCEACGAEALERLISGGNFVLKGDGWYKDLYSSSKPSGGGSKDSGGSGSGDSGSGTSAE